MSKSDTSLFDIYFNKWGGKNMNRLSFILSLLFLHMNAYADSQECLGSTSCGCFTSPFEIVDSLIRYGSVCDRDSRSHSAYYSNNNIASQTQKNVEREYYVSCQRISYYQNLNCNTFWDRSSARERALFSATAICSTRATTFPRKTIKSR